MTAATEQVCRQWPVWVRGFGVPPYGNRRSWSRRRAGEIWFRGRFGGGQADGHPAAPSDGDLRGSLL